MPDLVTTRELVTTESSDTASSTRPPYTRTLLPTRHTPARTGLYFQRQATWQDIPYIVRSAAASSYLALDFETRGTDYSWNFQDYDPASLSVEVVGIGLAWDKGSAYLPWTELYSGSREQVLELLAMHPHLLAHNYYFDGGVLETLLYPRGRSRVLHSSLTHSCTLALYRMLSNEGWAGQTHGLKNAMTEVLGWPESNETDVDLWLVLHGYYKGNVREDLAQDKNVLFTRWTEGTITPDKAHLWRVPHDLLGKYCVLDAEATYLLYTEHMLPALGRFPSLEADYRSYWTYLTDLHIQQRIHGIEMDRPALEARRDVLRARMSELEQEFRTLPEVAPYLEILEKEMLAELAAKEPPRYKKLPVRPPAPPMYKKDGTPSKNYLRWVDLEAKYTVPVQSLTWTAWQERWQLAVSGNDTAYRLNIQSKVQLAELLYRRMGYPIRILTETELPGTGADALAAMGTPGALLIERDEALKELGYIEKYLELLEFRSTIHPSFSIPGTSTGRLSSKDPNLQQVKKTKAMMDLFRARDGCSWVDLDFHALEPVVTTEFSGDSNMEAIYGNTAAPNDIYLFVAYTVPQWRSALAATGYDPASPTKETLARAKAECKHIRKVAKVVVLACAYGAGVDKIYENLTNDGVQISRDEVAAVHAGYWELFDRVRRYGYELQEGWWDTVDLPADLREQYRNWSRSRGGRDRVPPETAGYLLNGYGRPMCLTYDYRKDALNRFVQSTGHDTLVRYIHLVGTELTGRGIPWIPLVVDLHDSMTVEVPDEYVEQTKETYLDALDELNRQLGGRIRLKGTPSWGKNMSDIKEPEV